MAAVIAILAAQGYFDVESDNYHGGGGGDEDWVLEIFLISLIVIGIVATIFLAMS